MHGLMNNVEIVYVLAPINNASNTDAPTTRIDMEGYESVMFMTGISDSSADGVAALTLESNSVDSDVGMLPITGAVATVTCIVNDDINGQLLAAEVHKPLQRYIQAVLTSLVSNIAFGYTTATLVPLRKPSVQGVTVADTAYASG